MASDVRQLVGAALLKASEASGRLQGLFCGFPKLAWHGWRFKWMIATSYQMKQMLRRVKLQSFLVSNVLSSQRSLGLERLSVFPPSSCSPFPTFARPTF